MSQENVDILQRALQREKAARKVAEKILEEKSLQLYQTAQELKEANHKLEHLLDEKTSQLQGIFENINDAYLVMDLNGNVIKMNDAAIELFGYDIEKEKVNVVALIYNEDYMYAMQSFNELKSKGAFTNYTARVNTKNKGIRWIHINASVVFDKDKNPIAAQGIVRDITEAKRTAKLIEDQRQELDVIVQNSSFGVVLTQNGQILRTNETIQKALGFSKEELLERTIKDVSLKEDYPLSKEYIAKMDAGEIDNFVIDKRYRKKDNSILWAKTNVNAVRDKTGVIKYQVAIIEDITQERERSLIINMINEVAKSLLGKVDIYDIALEITNSIATYLNTEDCVIYIVDQEKETVEQIAAYGEKVTNDGAIINKMSIPIGKGIVGTVAKTGKPELIANTDLDKRYVTDTIKRHSELVVPILSDNKVIGIIDSEHSQKNYFTQKHLETLQNVAGLVSMQLKSAINLRERQKAENQNKILVKELEKNNNELQEYAHIVSHDLKSPLRSIEALTSWIKEDNKEKLDEASLKNFSLIEMTLEKMEQLISDILKYSSIGSNDQDSQMVDLTPTIQDLIQVLYVPEHITITILRKLPTVKGDKTKLQQVFQNLISNAIKFNDKEKGIITIDYEEKKSYHQFSVSDNGIGIEKKYHDKIFKIFNSLKQSKDSSGIGLSIVKKIIDLYQGDIWIESEIHKGTTFFFTLKK
ncbi:PAS domain S-box protein [uncultured Dokdonia sp.]|uniref:PAS domain S-box protein n=1 Tax=uncultured Dokdonia sp. TaxID=575653 RepID=UPI00260375D3|nr:PAS domain S-box protein [uncultured Dokdonia sp.]